METRSVECWIESNSVLSETGPVTSPFSLTYSCRGVDVKTDINAYRPDPTRYLSLGGKYKAKALFEETTELDGSNCSNLKRLYVKIDGGQITLAKIR